MDESVIRADPNRTRDPGTDRGRGGGRALGRASFVRPGILRPGQRVLRGVGEDLAGSGGAGRYLEEFVYGVEDRAEYVERCGGLGAAHGRTDAGLRGGELWVLSAPARDRPCRSHAARPTPPPSSWPPSPRASCATARWCSSASGCPNLACNLARATHAPNLVLIYESGAVGAVPERLPVSIGDPSLVTGSLMVCGMADVFQSLLQNGRIEVGFLGGAQIDRYGNINTTVVGNYAQPDGPPAGERRRRRDRHSRPANGGHQPAQPAGFPEAVDFVTSPGHGHGTTPGGSSGCPAPAPSRSSPTRRILEADPTDGELVLAALYPGVEADEVRAGVGWPLRCRPPSRRSTRPPRRAASPARRARSPPPLPEGLTAHEPPHAAHCPPRDRAARTPRSRARSACATWCCSTSSRW